MPIFEYQCRNCQHKFEVMLKTKKEAPGKCPQCGSIELNKLFSTAAVKINGGTESNVPLTRCGKDTTCCGSPIPCDSPACEN